MLDKDTILAFADAINAGRRAFGLPDVETWDVTGSEPGSTTSCLSARHLIGPLELCDSTAPITGTDKFSVGMTHFTVDYRVKAPLERALGVKPEGFAVRIPEAIASVTQEFDDIGEQPRGDMEALLEEIRDEFLAAGLEAE